MSPGPAALEARSGTRRMVDNLVKLLGGKAMAGLISLVYLVIIPHRLGVQAYGIFSLINAYVLMVGSLVAFSGFQGVVRYGAIALEAGDTQGFARIVRFMTVIELIFGVIAIVVAAALAPVIGPRLGWSHEAIEYATIYSLAVLATVRATPQGLLQIEGRFDLLGLHQTFSPLIRLTGAVLVWWFGGGLKEFLAFWLVGAVVEGVSMWVMALGAWRRLSSGAPMIGPWSGVLDAHRGIGRFILATNFDISCRELATNLAPLTVGWLLGPVAAGVLSLAQRACTVLQQPAVLLGRASYPILVGHFAKGELGELRGTVWRSTTITVVVAAVVTLILTLLSERLIVLMGGESFRGGGGLLALTAVARAVGLVSIIFVSAVMALGKPGKTLSITLLANIVLYPILPLLLHVFGLYGAGYHDILINVIELLALLAVFYSSTKRAITG